MAMAMMKVTVLALRRGKEKESQRGVETFRGEIDRLPVNIPEVHSVETCE